MFTGLVQRREKVIKVEPRERGLVLRIDRPPAFENLVNGESISIDGACLTLVNFDQDFLEFFVGAETVLKTTLAKFKVDQIVNLERSLSLGDRMGGHIVTGHVDGTGRLLKRYNDGECLGLEIGITKDQLRWVIPKGSVCLNGVSLTVNEINRDQLSLSVLLIPETLARTNLGDLKVEDFLNVEFDQTVKIIAHQLAHYGVQNEQHPGIN